MKIVNTMRRYGAKVGAPVVALGSLFMASASQAAILATDLQAIQTSVQADLDVIIPWALTFMGIILAATLGFKMVKRFTGSL